MGGFLWQVYQLHEPIYPEGLSFFKPCYFCRLLKKYNFPFLISSISNLLNHNEEECGENRTAKKIAEYCNQLVMVFRYKCR